MSTLHKLSVRGFRNLAPLVVSEFSQFNVIHGENGAGKSNLLEAIYYLSTLRSFRDAHADEMMTIGARDSYLEAVVSGVSVPSTLEVSLSKDKARTVRANKKKPRSALAWFRHFPSVIFHPSDVDLAVGAPGARRSWLDSILCNLDSVYAASLSTYDKALRSRNRLLKEGSDRNAIEAFDELLASSGTVVSQARKTLVHEIAPFVSEAFGEVTGDVAVLELSYKPRVEPTVEGIRAALRESYEKDVARGFTVEGPHGDDIVFQMRTTIARHYASQGQQRVMVLAMKLAELRMLSERLNTNPVLLLDDVSSELDRTRNRRFFELLSSSPSQVFLTTTHPEFILVSERRKDFRVEAGIVKVQSDTFPKSSG